MLDNDTPAADQGPDITRAYLAAHHPELVAAIRTEGEAAERERITGVYALLHDDEGKPRAAARGHEKVVVDAAKTPGLSKAEAALKLLDARDAKESGAAAAKLASIQGDEAALPKPGPGAHAGIEPGTPSVVDRLRAAGELRKGKKASANGAAASRN